MSRVTICPNFLILRKNLTPENIEEYFINPVSEFLDELDNYNVELFLEANILDLMQQNYPWNLLEDNTWKSYLLNWQAILFGKINKKCACILDSSATTEFININCVSDNEIINNFFSKFLNDFKNLRLNNDNFEEGIFIHNLCNQKESFFNITNPSDLIKIEYPWLQVYNTSLPPKGDYPFIPPNNWRNNIIARGNQNGFLDIDNNEWCWDRLHNNHWDVQHRNGGHTNVNCSGKIL